MTADEQILELLQDLTGMSPRIPGAVNDGTWSALLRKGEGGIGYSQFNELLLLLGYDRVTRPFFRLLAAGSPVEDEETPAIQSVEDLEAGVDRIRQMSLLFYGNVEFGYKVLSRKIGTLMSHFGQTQPLAEEAYMSRHLPAREVEPISGDDAYYLGYVIEDKLDKRLRENPTDASALAEEEKRKGIVEVGKRNHHAYLASDHLDVYVATSMRERHEFSEIARFSREVFGHSRIKNLRLRWFDPTQAYCKDRVDKGLAEALMLKRAKCTLYLAQEVDTLGKDSELASTLAQGKPVIAYVPSPDLAYMQRRLLSLIRLEGLTVQQAVLNQLRVFRPELAWSDLTVQGWLADPSSMNPEDGKKLLRAVMTEHYDKRADLLRKTHPLGIQVNLASGVANGVLVARSAAECAELIYRIATRSLAFTIEKSKNDSVYLREKISGSIYRVMTSDEMLANSFWNYYFEPSEGEPQ